MEFNLITLLPPTTPPLPSDEFLAGQYYRLTGPYPNTISTLKYHCISYVWGAGKSPVGSFFNCQREISDQTKPSLEAGIRASWLIKGEEGKGDAFWIDRICIPQEEVNPKRGATLER